MTDPRPIEPRGLKYFVDVRTGTYHTSVGCGAYTLPTDAWWAFPYYQKDT